MISTDRMIIYNVTVNIEETVMDEWLRYMKETHIPDVMNTGCFKSYSIQRVLSTQPDETGATFAVQYRCPDMETYETYQRKFASDLQRAHTGKFQGKFAAFRTLLEEIE